ncbi:PD40 domain-containing protein [Paenibacillus sp. GSMTC-2017]|uniref:TolB family protein n=1 Tax=Paenibacillus sp. GSMTC-2017 TaxID=2794350 RepID=UPI0018D5BC64|nr:PD40 domain-containing protein [Paenibacillus sp. GSMTC-2017]MBH5320283.1 PD40 domain-containing protein [Paenibacillus sp. GSMTC-2017]
MKIAKMGIAMFVTGVLLFVTACSSETNSNRVVIKETEGTITVIDNASKEAGEHDVSVEKIERYENVEITDWLDDETVIVSKENTTLEKMKLEELSDSYPRSLYFYNINTKQYKLLKEQNNMFLGGATLSADKKHLLYHEFTFGDPAYYVLNLETLDSFGLFNDEIGGAVTAKWADENTIIGAAYSRAVYTASTDGSVAPFAHLSVEAFLLIEQMKENIYYVAYSDETLKVLNLTTKEKTNLNINNVYGVVPSPDGNQILVNHIPGSKSILTLSDANGENQKTITEGTVIGGVSWSPDQRMISYTQEAAVNGVTVKGLYIYDMLTGKSTQIAVDIENAETSWSPSGKTLVYTEKNDNQFNSAIVHLKFSSQK